MPGGASGGGARGEGAPPGPAPREVALAILAEVGRGRRLDVAFEARAPGLAPADRAWVQELTYGVVRFRGRIDHLLGIHLDRGTGSVDPGVLDVLRLGAWQVLSMGSVPAYAAVSESVELVRSLPGRAGRASGLVNAVLRRLAEAGGGPERFPSLAGDPVAHLSTWGSHPRWLVERWVARFGAEEAAALVEANNRIPRVHLRRVDTGARVELPPGTPVVAALEAHHPALVQDPAAAEVVDLATRGLIAGEWVADLCAAPGGKAMGMAGAGARVVALDRSPGRLRRLRENAQRLGLEDRVLVGAALGEAPPLPPESMDRVLVDAPCTGTGTLARHPDARWRLEPSAIGALTEVQDRILDGAAGVVRPGGILVYSTCTLEPEENGDRVRAFLARHPGFRLEEEHQVLPHQSGTDGAYAALVRREGPEDAKRGNER